MSSSESGGRVGVAAVDLGKVSINDNAAALAMCEEGSSVQAERGHRENVTTNTTENLSKFNEFISPRRSYLEAKSSGKELLVSTNLVQSRHKWIDERNNSIQKSVCSPTNSICSQSTALSRARTEIEGRRKSRAAARARMNAALDEVQSSKSIAREAAKERAWAALADIQRSRSFGSRGEGINSMRSSSNEESEERRQPRSAAPPALYQVEEDREETEEDMVGKVLTVGTPRNSTKSGRPENLATTKKPKDKGQAGEKKQSDSKRSRDRKRTDIHYAASIHAQGEMDNEPASNFQLTEEALLAMSQAALEVAPKIADTIPSPEKDSDTQITNAFNNSAACAMQDDIEGSDVANTMSSKLSKKTYQSESNSSYILPEEDRIALSHVALGIIPKETVGRGRTRDREAEPSRSKGNVATASAKEFLFRKDSESTAPARNVKTNAEPKQNPSLSAIPQNRDRALVDVAGSESSYDDPLSSSSSEDNEVVNIKSVDTDDSMGGGALDKMMYQGKPFEPKPKPALLDMGTTNNSEDSGHSSNSSEQSHMSSPNKSMGPVWQKAIDDAQAQRPKSPFKSDRKAEVQAELEGNVADDETVYTVRTGFNHERMKYVASFGVIFFLMNSLFVTLDASSFAIRVFGLVGLISSGFPLIVIWMYLVSLKTQYSFWTCSVKMLLLGCLCQCCILILFILGLDLGAGAWAAGIISLAWLLALMVEMNTNYPLRPPTKPGEAESSHLIIGDLWKCLVLFGLNPVDEQDHGEAKRRRSLRRKKKKSRLLDEVLDEQETRDDRKEQHQSVYSPPDIV